tara:strand:- start:201376 stop:201741 length:366 start_codon:yes stop_codon:yes gene_type:complete
MQVKFIEKFNLKHVSKFLSICFILFFAHTVEIWFYAYIYLWLHGADFGTLEGVYLTGGWDDYLYFSATSYTTLGVGDIFPTGAMRIIASIEAINGLMLIAWSATFLYFHMEKRWLIKHHED